MALTLPQADWVVIMGKDGTILEQGPRATLQDSAAGVLARYGVAAAGEEEGEGDGNGRAPAAADAAAGSVGEAVKPAQAQEEPPPPEAPPQEEGESKGRLVSEEGRAKGALTLATYRAYVLAMGGLPIALLLVAEYGAVELLRYLQTRSLGRWVDRLVASSSSATNGANGAGPFILLSAAGTLVILLRALTQCWASLRASGTVHRAMAKRTLRAPCAWFERTPIGRVLNRFSRWVFGWDGGGVGLFGCTACLLIPITDGHACTQKTQRHRDHRQEPGGQPRVLPRVRAQRRRRRGGGGRPRPLPPPRPPPPPCAGRVGRPGLPGLLSRAEAPRGREPQPHLFPLLRDCRRPQRRGACVFDVTRPVLPLGVSSLPFCVDRDRIITTPHIKTQQRA